ncbi:MAG: O-methyltransferase [Candidatus Bipolaricaulia bacterium]
MNEELISTQVRSYVNSFVPPRPVEMQAMEAYAKQESFPIIGPAAGYLCYQITRMIGATRVFEMGSGYGYSTAWFAQAVNENGGGIVHHVVWDEELSQKARAHLRTLGFEDIVQYHVSEAVQTLRETPGPFDLIFNDIDKPGYPDSLPVVKEKLRSGGVLITDNMFGFGRIFDESNRSSSAEGIREFKRLITNDPDWISTIVPVRDGLLVAYKK